MRERLILFCAFLLISAPAALANPVDPDSLRGFTGISAFALIVEALVVAGLLTWRKFRFSRVFFAWLGVTAVTYWYMTGGLRLDWLIADWSALSYWLIVLLLEIAAVLAEAWVIARMAESRFFREPQTAFPYVWALAVSLVGNAVSFGIGFFNR